MFRETLMGAVVAGLVLLCQPVAAQMDLSGTWHQRQHEDQPDRGGGPDIGDYMGLPLNDAARLRADTWNATWWSVVEHQCTPHPADYALHGPASLRIWPTVDPLTQKVVAWHVTHQWMLTERVIWMDGREHPPETAPLTWMGFSTGHWEGDILVVNTSHLKEGWIRRNGVARSDKASLTQYWIRNDDETLTVVNYINDPVYLTEPLVRSWNWELDPGYAHSPYPCDPTVETVLPEGYVAHFLPGENPQIGPIREKYLKRYGIPPEVMRGGAEQMYPAYLKRLKEILPAGQ